MEVFQGSQAVLPALPGLPSLATALDRAWSADAAKQEPTAPALVSCSPGCCLVGWLGVELVGWLPGWWAVTIVCWVLLRSTARL
jgi:hypothetical protein